MKKRISIVLATVLSLACMPLYMNVSAFRYSEWHDVCQNKNIDANAVIVDVNKTDPENVSYFFYLEWPSGFNYASAKQLEPYIENSDMFVVGDLLKMENISILDTYPGELGLNVGVPTIEYCGNGIELLGSDFEKSLLNHICEEKEFYNSKLEMLGYTIVKGDATEDENVDILDVITVNKTVLGKQELNGYAKCVSDINENGEVDANDSLEIMKYIVGLTDTLEAEA